MNARRTGRWQGLNGKNSGNCPLGICQFHGLPCRLSNQHESQRIVSSGNLDSRPRLCAGGGGWRWLWTSHLRMMTPRTLNRIAVIAVAIPFGVWVGVEALTRLIPGCSVQMYGENACYVGSLNIAVPLLVAGTAGVSLIVILGVCVALPLFVAAAVLSWRTKREPMLDNPLRR